MVVFFGCVMIGFVISWIIACKWGKDSVAEGVIIVIGTVMGIVLGVLLSFLGGSFFVKKEIVAEKYVISPMIFDGKPIVALTEKYDSLDGESNNFLFKIKEGEELKFVKHYFKKEDIFFSLKEDEERRLEIKRSKICKRRMWIWFFYGNTGIVESKAVLKKGDSFLILPRYYSL